MDRDVNRVIEAVLELPPEDRRKCLSEFMKAFPKKTLSAQRWKST
jgi:hypothetical protein